MRGYVGKLASSEREMDVAQRAVADSSRPPGRRQRLRTRYLLHAHGPCKAGSRVSVVRKANKPTYREGHAHVTPPRHAWRSRALVAFANGLRDRVGCMHGLRGAEDMAADAIVIDRHRAASRTDQRGPWRRRGPLPRWGCSSAGPPRRRPRRARRRDHTQCSDRGDGGSRAAACRWQARVGSSQRDTRSPGHARVVMRTTARTS